ncbi:hypothetical protein BD779DRAFT_1492046 [Infundibulicybe gibba]|nr:hypothetical protein BD779DRAFT_1492046 [Infundibulicybe gibba]
MLPPQRSALSPPTHTINTPLAGIISTSSHSQGDEFYESDDTYLHYEPAINHTYPSPPYGRDKRHDEDTPNKLKIQPLGDIHTHKLLTPIFTKTPSRTRKAKSKEAPNVTELDDSWEKRLTETIQEDDNLHLRILRYEPSSGKLKSKLRLFLDKQAIHFYGAEPTGRRS